MSNKSIKPHIVPKKFSQELEGWLSSGKSKTLLSLVQFSEDKSFAVTLMMLMFLSALPIPTGGITHVLEVIAMLVVLEMIIGFKTIWLPKSASKIKLGKTFQGKVIPAMMKRIKWLEDRSSKKFKWIFNIPLVDRLTGLIMLVFIIVAFIAPPFSGLDTLPALGVVIICLAIILDDIRALFAGIIVGSLGVFIAIGFGELIIRSVRHIFS